MKKNTKNCSQASWCFSWDDFSLTDLKDPQTHCCETAKFIKQPTLLVFFISFYLNNWESTLPLPFFFFFLKPPFSLPQVETMWKLSSGLFHFCTSKVSVTICFFRAKKVDSEVRKCKSPLENFYMVSTLDNNRFSPVISSSLNFDFENPNFKNFAMKIKQFPSTHAFLW